VWDFAGEDEVPELSSIFTFGLPQAIDPLENVFSIQVSLSGDGFSYNSEEKDFEVEFCCLLVDLASDKVITQSNIGCDSKVTMRFSEILPASNYALLVIPVWHSPKETSVVVAINGPHQTQI